LQPHEQNKSNTAALDHLITSVAPDDSPKGNSINGNDAEGA
jgi:hypothetical protein